MKKAPILTALLAVLATACVTTPKYVPDPWLGYSISAAVAQLGPPQSTTPLPGGNTTYTWEVAYGSVPSGIKALCRTVLHVDGSGTIVDISPNPEFVPSCKSP